MSGSIYFNEYQFSARETSNLTSFGNRVGDDEFAETNGLVYPTLGLAGEVGEFADHLKKIRRDDGGVITDERRVKMFAELGDILWYVSEACSVMGFSLNDVASHNLDKVHDRKSRGVIGGDGDFR